METIDLIDQTARKVQTMPLMKCGHVAQGLDSKGNPVCAICYGIREGATEVAEPAPLEGRKARCVYYGSPIKTPGEYHGSECAECNARYREAAMPGYRVSIACQCECESSTSLPFFEYCPDNLFDRFYCGCHSWN